MERIGVYGGTFDPPHNGHIFLAREALNQLVLDRVLWVLTPNPPHKTGQEISPLADRLAMLELALENQAGFQASMIDIDRPPPHYAVDTLHLLRYTHLDAALVYLIGADSLRDLPRWKRPAALVKAVDEFGVLRRHGAEPDLPMLIARFPALANKIRWIDAPLQDIAASRLREMAGNPEALLHFMPANVAAYIADHHLYQDS